jgi:hypothetical protein
MLPGMMMAHAGGLDASSTMREVIHALGLTSGLQLILDAGDEDSYTSGQTWTDLSGAGTDFYRGSTSSSQSTDPTFNGVVGGRSSAEYFSLDGGDFFTIVSANPSWVEDMHQSGGTWTVAEWIRVGTLSDSNYWGSLGDGQLTGQPTTGILLGVGVTAVGTTNSQFLAQVNNNSSSAWFKKSTASVTGSAWNFVAASVNLGTGLGVLQINGTTESSTTAPGALAAGSATAKLNIGAIGSGEFPDTSGMRFGQIAIWDTALSAAQLAALFQASRGKYGI